MSTRTYKLIDNVSNGVHIATDVPGSGLSWREAKKQLREYFLLQASLVRHMRESEFIGISLNEDVLNSVVTHESVV